jgi:ATPase subunit of ABC transporter with duplicated ATPase domains
MATFQARQVNVLVLDEPTNHLDVPAIEQLESALADYTGTLVVVSHDQAFLERVGIDRVLRLA